MYDPYEAARATVAVDIRCKHHDSRSAVVAAFTAPARTERQSWHGAVVTSPGATCPYICHYDANPGLNLAERLLLREEM